MRTIFTFGYTGRVVWDVMGILRENDSYLVDIRIKPMSRNAAWSMGPLTRTFGERYRWIRAFGNINYRGGPIALADVESGMVSVSGLLEQHNIALMCAESDYRLCHRVVVAQLISERFGFPVVHLLLPGKDGNYLETTGVQPKLF